MVWKVLGFGEGIFEKIGKEGGVKGGVGLGGQWNLEERGRSFVKFLFLEWAALSR